MMNVDEIREDTLPVMLSAAKHLRHRAGSYVQTGDPSLRSGWHAWFVKVYHRVPTIFPPV